MLYKDQMGKTGLLVHRNNIISRFIALHRKARLYCILNYFLQTYGLVAEVLVQLISSQVWSTFLMWMQSWDLLIPAVPSSPDFQAVKDQVEESAQVQVLSLSPVTSVPPSQVLSSLTKLLHTKAFSLAEVMLVTVAPSA